MRQLIKTLCLHLLSITHASATSAFHRALLDDNLPPSSSKCLSSNKISTSFSYTWTNRSLNFSSTNAKYEQSLFLLEMTNNLPQNNTMEPKGWTMRISKGGNIYSFVGPWGQAISPNILATSPFMDEVWQSVAVSTTLNKPNLQRSYFIHQAGAYFDQTKTPSLKSPWYSPNTGTYCSGNSCSIVSWSQQAWIPTTFNSSKLAFSRYTNCGDGVLEHVFAIHNMATDPNIGPPADVLDFLNSLWMGFRYSAFQDIVRSSSTSDNLVDIDPIPDFSSTPVLGLYSLSTSAGYTVFAENVRSPSPLYALPCGNSNGNGSMSPCSDPGSQSLALKLISGPPNDPGPCTNDASLTASSGVVTFSCRLNATANITEGVVSTTAQNLILVNTRTKSFMYLHPLQGVTAWSRYVSGVNRLIISPADNTTTTADINQKFPSGTDLEVQYQPNNYKLPCGDGTGAVVDCSNSSSLGPPIISIMSNSPNNTCEQSFDYTNLYGKIVARCRIAQTVPINSGDPNTQVTFVSNNTSPQVEYRAFGVLFWSYKDPSTQHFWIYLFTGDGGVLWLRNYFTAGRIFIPTFKNSGKPWEQNMALSSIHGSYSSLNESYKGATNVYSNTDVRYGVAGNQGRDYTPFTLRTSAYLAEGYTYSKRHFLIADRLDRMQNRSLGWVNETFQYVTPQSNANSGRVIKLVKTSSSTFGAALGNEICTKEDGSLPFVCFGSTRPQTGLYAHFAISCGNSSYLGTDRSYFNPKTPNESKEPWICNKTNTTDSPTSVFLGFFIPGACKNIANFKFDPIGCGDEMPSTKPSKNPSKRPSMKPSKNPSKKPSNRPSEKPSKKPSKKTEELPSKKPSSKPSKKPSRKPSKKEYNGEVKGDPHFKTWHGDFFSYHGECDLVLVKNPQFSDGLGLFIHVRTKIERHWSYVKNAAIKIGDDVVEVEGRGKVWDKSAESVYFINGMMHATLPFSISAKFPLTYVKENICNKEGSNCVEAAVYTIDLENGESIKVTQKWGVLHVSVSAKGRSTFGSSVGIMGHFSKPGLLGRDEVSKFTDPNLFGQEWQVLSTEPRLFHEQRTPIHPEQCILPEETRRRLGESTVFYQLAEEACAEVEESSKEFCIFDVTAAGVAEAAAIYYPARNE